MDCTGSENQMKVPKLNITYSFPYDQLFTYLYKKKFSRKQSEEGFLYAKKLQKEWDKISDKIFKTLSDISGLKWKKDYVECFVVKHIPNPISRPLTLRMNRNFTEQKTIIIHELTHNLLFQNYIRIKRIYSLTGKIYRKYEKESFNTKIHLPVHAIVKLTLEKTFGREAKKYIKYETWFYGKHSVDYIRSWEIVEKEGPENILKEVIK
jgi:hypothetical protein